MKIQQKHIIAATIGLVTISGAFLFLQYKRLRDYCIGINHIRVNTLTATAADIDIFLNLKNQSSIKIEIESQQYSVYLNDSLIAKSENAFTQTIAPESLSVIGVNVKFDPTRVGEKLVNVLLSLQRVIIRIDISLKVKFLFFTIDIPYVHRTTLKDLMTPKVQKSSKVECR